MKKIAILTKHFVTWNGGVDFLKRIIRSLIAIHEEEDLEIYILVETEKPYKKSKEISGCLEWIKNSYKKILYKLKFTFSKEFTISQSNKIFEEFHQTTIIEYQAYFLKTVIKKLKIDLLMPHLDPTYFTEFDIPTIGYLFDCQHKYFPEFFSEKELQGRDLFFQKMIDGGGKIIVNAKSVKNDLIKFYSAKEDQIFNLPFSPKSSYQMADAKSSLEEYDLPEKYFIISNQFWVHKDHETAFKAFSKFLENSEHHNLYLICTGIMEDPRQPSYISELKALINESQIEHRIKFLGLIKKSHQLQIMENAIAVIQPTLFEGGPGGGSVVDAISLDVPVIVSDIPVNLEIENYDKIEFFKTKDADDLCKKMQKVLNSKYVKSPPEALNERSNQNMIRSGRFIARIIKDLLN